VPDQAFLVRKAPANLRSEVTPVVVVDVETIFGLFKTEIIRRNGPWRNIEEVEFATLEWVDWFNNHRLLEPIGNIPPAELEEMYYARQRSPAVGAGLN